METEGSAGKNLVFFPSGGSILLAKKKMVREKSDRSLSQDANFVHIPHGSAFIPTPAVAERDVSYFLLFTSL